MGKGDKKTRRGKIYAGSYGNVRKHDAKTSTVGKTPGTGTPRRAATRRKAT